MVRHNEKHLSILTVNLPASVLNFLDKLIEKEIIMSRSAWIRDAIEMYWIIYIEAEKRLEKLPNMYGVETKSVDLLTNNMIAEVITEKYDDNVELTMKKYGRRKHMPLGNIFHPEIDYSKPNYPAEIEVHDH